MAQHTEAYAAAARAARRACREKADIDHIAVFPSRKNSCRIRVWSAADYRFCVSAERSSKIIAFHERPDILILGDDGSALPFVVDFALTMQDGRPVFVSVAGNEDESGPAYERLLGLASTLCAGRGVAFFHVPFGFFDPIDVGTGNLVREASRVPSDRGHWNTPRREDPAGRLFRHSAGHSTMPSLAAAGAA